MKQKSVLLVLLLMCGVWAVDSLRATFPPELTPLQVDSLILLKVLPANTFSYRSWEKSNKIERWYGVSVGVDSNGDRRVTALNLTRGSIKRVSPAIGSLSALDSLMVQGCSITELPKEIGNLQSLTCLDLSWNELTFLPNTLGKLERLQILNLRGSKIVSYPKTLVKLKNLQHLDLRKTGLSKAPHWLPELSSLKALFLQDNNLTKLPLIPSYVDTLDLSGNMISAIDETIGTYRSLRYLDLSRMRERFVDGVKVFMTLSDAIGNMERLEYLNLEGNRIPTLPPTIGKLQRLDYFNVESNKLRTLPDEIGNMHSLRCLLLTNNRLVELPQTIGNLKELKYLHVSGNDLAVLPDEWSGLESLQTLYVSKNKLETLPASIVSLPYLTDLDISYNNMRELPDNNDLFYRLSKPTSGFSRNMTAGNLFKYHDLPPVLQRRLFREFWHKNLRHNFHGVYYGGNSLHFSMQFSWELFCEYESARDRNSVTEELNKKIRPFRQKGVHLFVEPGVNGIRMGGGVNWTPIRQEFLHDKFLSLRFQTTYFYNGRDFEGYGGKFFIGPEVGLEKFGALKVSVGKEIRGDELMVSVQGGFSSILLLFRQI